VLSDVPTFEADPAWRLRTRLIPARRSIASWLRNPGASDPGFAPPTNNPHFALADALLARAAAGFDGVMLVDMKAPFCATVTQCVYRQGDVLLYSDSNHLSTAGSFYAVRNLRLPDIER
jgi:hypothetical protein